MTTTLRLIATHADPMPQVHWQPCGCARCQDGGTHPMEWHRRYHVRARLDRDMPGEGLFA